ncbi:MAG: MBL fold metallo-hydrolase [Bacteroidota bacterium]|nr:MBL fold metallo-hydrolase [Bacteroidota bacterium]
MKSFGKLPSGERLERILNSPNYKNGSFQNLSETPSLAIDKSFWDVLIYYFSNKINPNPPSPIRTQYVDFNIITNSNIPEITWFGHSSYLIQFRGFNIIIDPVFSGRASFSNIIGPKAYNYIPPFDINQLPKIDMIILTHDHYDHLDYESISFLKKFNPIFYGPLGIGSHLEYWGIPDSNINELDWWDTINTILPDIQLTATPARHFSGRSFVRNKTLWTSYVMKIGDNNIFIGGDSGYDVHFKEIGNKYGPFDITILECGQYDKHWPYIHMMPEETVQAAIDLKSNVLFPVHWGKFSLSVHSWDDPIKRVTKTSDKLQVQYTTPRIGEKIVLNSIYPKTEWWNEQSN